MSYEYSSVSSRLDFPNPFRIENHFYFVAAGVLILGALALLLLGRSGIASHMSFWSLTPLIVGVYLLLRGIGYGGKALLQLRFFFGRGEPKNLASEILADQDGKGDGAGALKETLRQNALTFQEPKGALNGLLYTWIPELIYAPHPIQIIAQRQFQTGLAIAVTFLSFCIAWIGFSNSASASWMGLFYFAFTAFLLIKPLEHGAGSRADLGVKGIVILVLASILGPVVIPLLGSELPDISWLSLNVQTFLLLLIAIGSVSLFFIALTKQMIAPPPTTMACEQHALSMNSHPKQLFDELDREMQKGWTEQIPNRRYSRVLPIIGNGAGSFAGEVLEETQPMPREDMRQIDFSSCFSLPRYKWLGWLNVLGVLLIFAGVVSMIAFSALLKPENFEPSVAAFATFGVAMLLVGGFCFKAGHTLWGRFDFVSKLVWIETKGNYQSAKLDYGNQFTDRIKTEKQVINIETMTLRVWVAQLESVSFGKDSQRWLVGMRGLQDQARYFSQHLIAFAGNQSIIVSPTSGADMQKVAALGAINQIGGQPVDVRSVIMQACTNTSQSDVQTYQQPTLCKDCGEGVEAGMAFCGNCGIQLVA